MKNNLVNKLTENKVNIKTAYSYLNGTRLPSMQKAIELDKKGVIPLSAWKNIKEYSSNFQKGNSSK
jgi:hypothetical protein